MVMKTHSLTRITKPSCCLSLMMRVACTVAEMQAKVEHGTRNDCRMQCNGTRWWVNPRASRQSTKMVIVAHGNGTFWSASWEAARYDLDLTSSWQGQRDMVSPWHRRGDRDWSPPPWSMTWAKVEEAARQMSTKSVVKVTPKVEVKG